MPVPNSLEARAGEMRAWRRWLHQHPEIGFDLPETAAFVEDRLREIGVDEIHTGIARTGIVAVIRGQGDGDSVAIRADMDALPMDEETGAPHASRRPGRMHACGHDGHTTMLLGAAAYLAGTRAFRGRAILIFQPAEEDGGGGRVMVEEGVMERFDVREVYALHNLPGLAEGHVATRPGPILGAVDDFQVTFIGKGGHAAHPDEARDPIPAAIAFVQALNALVTRERAPGDPMVLSVTRIHAGSANNVIPGRAEVAGTIRTYSADLRAHADARFHEIARGIAATFGLEVEIDYIRDYPATVNHADQTAFAAEVAREVVGADRVQDDIAPSMGAEDFAYMLEARPGAYLYLGQGTPFACHHPEYDFNDRIATTGAALLARLVERALPLDGTAQEGEGSDGA